ncbi:MAG: sigma-70 family RNA polymerase sigma factor [Micrococcales bacterium]|nr:sigma-70 family RNA polymerase sigma factor [Micrococcales bacterium]
MGNEFHSFAVPTILGELRRHFRDHAWAARVPRSLQEATLKVQRASDELRVARGQDPTPAEVADELGLVEEEVLQAMQARGEAMSSKSLDHPMGEDGAEAFGDLVGDTDPDLEYVELREAVRSALHKLPEREREILLMRFYGEHTQSEIAERMGLSQVHVSRLITRTLTALRDHVMNDVPLPKSWVQQAERAGDPERRRTAA